MRERNLIKTFFYLFYIKNVKNSILTMNYIINPLYCIIPSPKNSKIKLTIFLFLLDIFRLSIITFFSEEKLMKNRLPCFQKSKSAILLILFFSPEKYTIYVAIFSIIYFVIIKYL